MRKEIEKRMLSTLEKERLDQSEIFIELTPRQYIETAGYIFFRYS